MLAHPECADDTEFTDLFEEPFTTKEGLWTNMNAISAGISTTRSGGM
jgi:hypothetical protein